jgi:hypothetical protein
MKRKVIDDEVTGPVVSNEGQSWDENADRHLGDFTGQETTNTG